MNELRIGTPVHIAGLTLVPVERIQVQTKGDWGLYASKEPFAVIVNRDNHKQAFDCQGEERPIEELMEQLPQLGELLQEL